MSMGHLRNQLKDITFDNISASNIQTVGGRVFADSKSKTDVDDLVNIQTAWSAVHSPTSGRFIPQSSTMVIGTVEGGAAPATIMAPSGNQVQSLGQLIFVNSSGGTAAVTASINVGLGSMQILSESVANGATKVVTFYNEVKLDSNATFTVNADVEITATAFLYLVAQ